VFAWWTPDAIRNWWLGAATAALVDRAMTFAYFIPTMVRLMRSETPEEPKTVAKALQWVNLGYLRHAAALVAWLAALKGFSLLGRYGG
jgi:hypothetical protein